MSLLASQRSFFSRGLLHVNQRRCKNKLIAPSLGSLCGSGSNYGGHRRYFGSKGKKNKNKKDIKKKRLSLGLSQSSASESAPYGTPKTGLIFPTQPENELSSPDGTETNVATGASMGRGTKGICFNPPTDTSSSFTPMIDHTTVHDDAFTQSLKLQGQAPPPQSTLFQDLGKDMPMMPASSSSSGSGGSLNSLFDVASMYDPKLHLPNKPDFANPANNYEPPTPLGEELMKYIGVLGCPITMAEYMKRCLRDERYGYYTNPPSSSSSNAEEDDDDLFTDDYDDNDDDQEEKNDATKEGRGHRLIGQAGDFTTAPEISQIFGECITIWLLTQYEALGKPSTIQLVELGPGRGTLMCDILRSAMGIKGPGHEFVNALMNGNNSSSDNSGSISGVHFVEVSNNLKVTQREALQKLSSEKDDMHFHFVQWKSKDEKMKEMKDLMDELREKKAGGEDVNTEMLTKLMAEKQRKGYTQEGEEMNSDTTTKDKNTIPIHWHDSFESVPFQKNESDKRPSIPTFIIGQEFLDALPVHVFQKTKDGWREHMVDVALQDEENDESGKVQIQMRDGTTASTYSSASASKIGKVTEGKKKPRFRHVLSPGVTPALRSLLHIDDDGQPMNANAKSLTDAPDGTIMEVCPEALSLIQDIALRVEECRGAALMIDYGNEGSRDTLRAFRKHEQVDILSSPGSIDLTADVDFGALRNAVNVDMKRTREKMGENEVHKHGDAPEAFGPQTQGQFLASMGAVERAVNLLEDDSTTDEQAEDLTNALERLVSEDEMGERFKVLAIARKKDGIFPPPGF